MVLWLWRGYSKDMHWLLLAWDHASRVEVTGELRLTVAVSVDAGTYEDGEGKRFATSVAKVGDIVGADIMQSNIILGSLCCCILSWWPGFCPASTGFTNVCSGVDAAALKSLMCCSLLSGVQECYIGAYQSLYSFESTYLPPPYRAITSSFYSRFVRILMVLTASKTLPIFKHWMLFSMAWIESMSFWQNRTTTFVPSLANWMTLWRNSFLQWVRNQL